MARGRASRGWWEGDCRHDAKFKYDDHKPVEHRERVIDNLEQRGNALDSGAATQQRRRLSAIGGWPGRRNRT